ncbi:MAG: HAD-IA family hydrolase [Deltaproteobacteria bacterium]|jgi:putative hydrolase of the HAD superfamily|nr:HAD-IA family hydrolase [Deltaproteobacteria bacterium]MCL5880508.1 HAD-IA family hydrolase [Deltaproteobacteria bacterium]MDA8304689.1 HAD-IA family hydrolase [Deltaproteobacteria bacterium]
MSKYIKTVFLDIGSVLLTNGWDRKSRKLASVKFNLDYEDFEARHEDLFAIYEEGKISLDYYLDKTLFYKECSFTKKEFKAFMFDQSQPYPQMIDLFAGLKDRYKLKLVSINNEGLELSIYRIKKFSLDSLFDFFVTSCFVRIRKPDENIFKLALNLSYSKPEESIFIDDRSFNVETAANLGINAFRHTSYESTKEKLSRFGFS